jgi:hypothetical protein
VESNFREDNFTVPRQSCSYRFVGRISIDKRLSRQCLISCREADFSGLIRTMEPEYLPVSHSDSMTCRVVSR